MSDGKKPFFLTGANARILLNNRTAAFATDVSYRVTVKHATPRVLGRAEVETIQPLTYDVSGSLTVIRYGRGLQGHFGGAAPADASNRGDGVGSFGPSSPVDAAVAALGLPKGGSFDGAANENFDPSRFFQSKMFNIEIRQKVLNNEETPVVLLRDCRFDEMNFGLNKKGVATLTMSFRARYADDDTMIARKSGAGQEFS